MVHRQHIRPLSQVVLATVELQLLFLQDMLIAVLFSITVQSLVGDAVWMVNWVMEVQLTKPRPHLQAALAAKVPP